MLQTSFSEPQEPSVGGEFLKTKTPKSNRLCLLVTTISYKDKLSKSKTEDYIASNKVSKILKTPPNWFLNCPNLTLNIL